MFKIDILILEINIINHQRIAMLLKLNIYNIIVLLLTIFFWILYYHGKYFSF